MGRPKTEDTKKVVLTLPKEIAMTMEYFVKIQKEARTHSDLVIQLINKLVDEKRNTLNDKDSWKNFIKRMDDMKTDKLDEIFGDSSEEIGEDEESEEDVE